MADPVTRFRLLTACLLVVPSLLGGCDRDPPPPPPASTASTASAQNGLRVENTELFDAAMLKVLEAYVRVQEALAADTVEGMEASAQQIERHLDAVDASDVTGPDAARYAAVVDAARGHARALVGATELADARAKFKELSRSLVPWLNTTALPKTYELVWCSMAPGGWVQKSGPVRNPYYGASMLECGEKVAR